MSYPVTHLEVLVEEASAGHALAVLLPKIIPGTPFEIRNFPGKPALLGNLKPRLRGYAARLAHGEIKVVVLVDRDDDDCLQLKATLQRLAGEAGLVPQSQPRSVLNRIVVEELEAWFLGDGRALRLAYPRVPASFADKARFRDPDAVVGGTCQAFERLLGQHGYHTAGLRKLQAAQDIAPHMNVEENRSKSFQVFRDGVRRLVSGDTDA